jgi:phospholipid/cholesterol/gamma-HCH transport system substrate-binding protein
MDERRRLSLVVGIFVVMAVLVGGTALLTLGGRAGFLQPRYRLVTYFENVQGLVTGAPVRLVGKDAGTVEFITFAPIEGEVPPVRVVVQIDAAVQDRIRSDSVASIGTIGLLGDKYVEISMGTVDGRILREGEVLPSVSPVDLSEAAVRGTQAIDNIAILAENVNRVVEDFGQSMEGERIAEIVAAVAELLHEVKEGEGLLHSLIYDRHEGFGVESLERSLALLEELLREIAQGSGPLHTLIYGAPEGEDVLAQGTQAIENLNRILEKIAAGDGTLGLLVNDPTLYHDLQVLLGGARRSLVVRMLLRLATDAGS